jgi:hypothetical protein
MRSISPERFGNLRLSIIPLPCNPAKREIQKRFASFSDACRSNVGTLGCHGRAARRFRSDQVRLCKAREWWSGPAQRSRPKHVPRWLWHPCRTSAIIVPAGVRVQSRTPHAPP